MRSAIIVGKISDVVRFPDSQATTVVWKPDGSYGIQVGAYSKYDAAQEAAQSATKAAPQLLSEARILIDTQKMNNGSKLYRARGRPQQDRCPGRLPKTQGK